MSKDTGTLVLTRKDGESIHIGDDIKITVNLGNYLGTIKLVVQAPKDVPIIREELKK